MPSRVQVKGSNSASSSVSSIAATFDASPIEDNLIVVGAFSLYNPGTITPPSGYTTLWNSSSGNLYGWIGYKVAGSSESATVTVSWTGSRRATIAIAEYGGINTSDLINAQSTAQTGTGVTSLSSGTTAATDEADTVGIAIFGGHSIGDYVNPTYSNSFSEYIEEGDSGVRPVAYIADRTGIPDSTAVETTSTSTSGAGQDMVGIVLAINPGPLTSGVISVTDRTSTTISLTSTAATGGSESYTYQWHRDTSSGFTPGGGNQVAGATSSTLTDTGLTEGTTYYYKLVTDDGTSSVTSNEVSQEADGDPLVVISDMDDATSGTVSIMGPNIAMFTTEGSYVGEGEWRHAKVEWDFGDTGSDYNEHRGFCGGHFYDVEPESDTDYTVTCTITNSDGRSASATRTVRVTPNTRRVVYVDPDNGSASPSDPTDSGDPYDTIANCISGETETDLEVRLTAGKTHTWVGPFGGSSTSNCIVRSTVKGTKFTVTTSTDIISGGLNIGLRDCTVATSTAGSQVRLLDQRAGTPFRCYVIDSTSSASDMSGFVSTSSTVWSYLQDVTTENHDTGGDYWLPGDKIVLHGVRSENYVAGERPFRCSGSWLTMTSCYGEYEDTNGKSAMTKSGGTWVYIDQCEFEVGESATNGSSHCLKIGHNTDADVQTVIVERTLLKMRTGTTITSEACLVIGSTGETAVTGVCVRNCIMDGAKVLFNQGTTDTDEATDIEVVHCTILNPSTSADVEFQSKYGTCKVIDCLSLTYTSKGEVVSIVDSTSGNNDPTVTNSVWPPADSDDDVRVDGAVSRDDWATFNGTALGSGNLSKSISYDSGTYRPDDTDDSDILFSAPTEMGAVPEDYYGNARTGTYVAGAVDAEAVETPSVTPKMNVSNDAASLAAYIQQYGIPAPQLDITPHHPGVVIDTSGISQPGIMPNG